MTPSASKSTTQYEVVSGLRPHEHRESLDATLTDGSEARISLFGSDGSPASGIVIAYGPLGVAKDRGRWAPLVWRLYETVPIAVRMESGRYRFVVLPKGNAQRAGSVSKIVDVEGDPDIRFRFAGPPHRIAVKPICDPQMSHVEYVELAFPDASTDDAVEFERGKDGVFRSPPLPSGEYRALISYWAFPGMERTVVVGPFSPGAGVHEVAVPPKWKPAEPPGPK